MTSPQPPTRTQRRRCNMKTRTTSKKVTFAAIGGLSHHIKMLREIIILPLLYGELYRHFNIKPPRGVIFYGPPGTGKTLVAGALASEINKEADGKVSFYQRKGADILDKWVGESERKLRDLFEKARKTRPSVIFFDELDGLAPERSNRNDQVHSSIVATLLALMDGLEDSSGVVVIGATNRIESVDPALRRAGRFDREMYFPLPNTSARREIFSVHTRMWKHKPSSELLKQLADTTSGCCGSDLQAICAEAVLTCLKRMYPDISIKKKMDIDLDALTISEDDFFQARANITPTTQRLGGGKMRKLTQFIKPLLQRQIDKIVNHIEVLLPHFLCCNKKYVMGAERYAGRLVLKANTQQGLNTYVIPALLQKFEHIQGFVLDVPDSYTKTINNALKNLPSILVLSRVDDWWNLLDDNGQMSIISMLENMHAGLPILLIVTFNEELPAPLHSYFVYNSSIFIELDNPTTAERELFFTPLFFGKKCMSLWRVLHNQSMQKNLKKEKNDEEPCEEVVKVSIPSKKRSNGISKNNKYDKSGMPWYNRASKRLRSKKSMWRQDKLERVYTTAIKELKLKPTRNTTDVGGENNDDCQITGVTCSNIKHEMLSTSTLKSLTASGKIQRPSSVDELKIHKLWKHVTFYTTKDLSVVHLELLYDALLACIFINTSNFPAAVKGLQNTVTSFETVK